MTFSTIIHKIAMTFSMIIALTTAYFGMNGKTTALNSPLVTCPDIIPEETDFGDLNKPGSGRVLQMNHGQFEVDGEKVFLSGVNTAYVHLGKDFGNDQYQGATKREYECYLRNVHLAGGNTMRTFLHGRGYNTPEFRDGSVIGLDSKGSFVSDIKKYLRTAAKNNIVIFLSLWAGKSYAANIDLLINSESALQSYIDNALIPLVKAVKDEAGLGGFDIMSQTERLLLRGEISADPCYDTSNYNKGRHDHYSMQNILRFVSRQADGINSVDSHIIVTTESYSLQTVFLFNHFNNDCLLKAGGKSMGYLDFYSVNAFYGFPDPFKHNASDFSLDKALVISSFSEKHGGGRTSPEEFQWAYIHGYNGALSWAAKTHFLTITDSLQTQLQGLKILGSQNDPSHGGRVNFSLSKYDVVVHTHTF